MQQRLDRGIGRGSVEQVLTLCVDHFLIGQCPSGRLVVRDSVTGETLEPDLAPSIVLVEDPSEGVRGPVWVRGGISITSADGSTYEVRNRVTLCRCGASANKPFCDGSHFQAAETAKE